MPRIIPQFFPKFDTINNEQNIKIEQEIVIKQEPEDISESQNLTSNLPTETQNSNFSDKNSSNSKNLKRKFDNIKVEPEVSSYVILEPRQVQQEFPAPKRIKLETPDLPNSILKCQKCGKVFKLARNFKIHNCDKSCKFCGQEFKVKGKLFQHIQNIHQNQPNEFQFECKICSFKLKTAKLLNNHIKVVHLAKKYECDFDGKQFDTKVNFKKHMRVHQLPIKCTLCDVHLKPFSISQHVVDFHGTEKSFKCDICSKGFKIIGQLSRHKKIHDKKFECEICRRKFALKTTMNQHIKEEHENPRSFECEICQSRFKTKKHLVKHQSVHNNENKDKKVFNCSRFYCSFSTNYSRDFQKHQIAHKNLDEKFAAMKNPLKCDECPTMCKNLRAMRDHKKTVHPKELYQCDLCGKYIKKKFTMKTHVNVHRK